MAGSTLLIRHDPPWKAKLFLPESEHGGVWRVVTDVDDERDEYDVLEDPTEYEARLMAASPEMADVLKRMEWKGSTNGVMEDVCLFCGGIRPASCAAKSPPYDRQIGHRPACRVAAVLRKIERGA